MFKKLSEAERIDRLQRENARLLALLSKKSADLEYLAMMSGIALTEEEDEQI